VTASADYLIAALAEYTTARRKLLGILGCPDSNR
jgi:hypothetical protein